MKRPARTQRATTQIRSTRECQNWRKSNPRFGSTRGSVKRNGADAEASGRFTLAGVEGGRLITKNYSRDITRATPVRKGGEREKVQLKKAFRNCDCISGQNKEAAAATARESLRIYLDHLIAAGGLSPDADPFGRGDASVTAGHRDCFQNINTTRASLRHFVAAGPIDLSQDRETALGVTHQHDIYLWIHQIIAPIELGQARSGLGKRESRKTNRTKQRHTQIALCIQAAIRAQIVFAKDFHRNLIIWPQHVSAWCADRNIRSRRWCRRCRSWRGGGSDRRLRRDRRNAVLREG